MPWYDNYTTIIGFNKFNKFVRDQMGHDPQRTLSFWSMVCKVQNDVRCKFRAQVGLQSTTSVAQKAEIILAFFAGHSGVMRGRDGVIDNAAGAMQVYHNRTYPMAQRAPDSFAGTAVWANSNGHHVGPLWNRVVPILNTVTDEIQGWYDLWGTQKDEMADVSLSTERTLQGLRDHNKMKLVGSVRGGHEKGQFVLHTRATDGKPVLLVSSKEAKAVAQKYLDTAAANHGTLDRVMEGTFQRNKTNKAVTFTITNVPNVGDKRYINSLIPTALDDMFRQALTASGVVMSVLLTDKQKIMSVQVVKSFV